ncbi:MAG: FAD-dependent oxidoreductase [bacterium]
MKEKFNVIIIGGGPAGTTAALTLAQRGMKNVVLLERGKYPGSKNVMGGVILTTILNKIIPDFWGKGAPVERNVSKRCFALLSPESETFFSFKNNEFNRPPYNNIFTVLRAKFDKWFAEEAEKAGVTLLCNSVVDELIKDENGKVVGVQTRVAGGTSKEEGQIFADVVICAEGANSTIALKEGMREKFDEHFMAVAVKEVIELPAKVIEDRFHLEGNEGTAFEFYGDAVQGLHGSGFLYTNKTSISIGIGVVISDIMKAKLNPNDILDHFKNHPCIRPLLRGGKTLEYAAHMIPEGGYKKIPKLVKDGLLLVGDAAGFINTSPLHEGSNLAMASGIMAAETILEAKEKNDFSSVTLSNYVSKLENSFVFKDMKKYSEVPEVLSKSPELFNKWPKELANILTEVFTISETPKEIVEEKIMNKFNDGIGAIPFAIKMVQLRNAMKSFYYGFSKKITDFVATHW